MGSSSSCPSGVSDSDELASSVSSSRIGRFLFEGFSFCAGEEEEEEAAEGLALRLELDAMDQTQAASKKSSA